MSEGGVAPRIRRATTADKADWDAFVAAHPRGSFFHRFEWQSVFQHALRHRTHYLVAEQFGTIVGIMPLVSMKHILFGRSLSSNPFATYAGPIATDIAICALLEKKAVEIAEELAVGALEIRYREPSGAARPVKLLYETFSKAIEVDADANMNAIRSKQRNIIRKGMKAGLVSEQSDLETFYNVYSESVRNLGTPVFTKRLFKAIHAAFPVETEFFAVRHEGRVVSAAMLFYSGDEVCPYYWGGQYAARRVSANDFLTWEIINRAAARGCTVFDFGRSKKDTGAHQWKINLGFEPSQLYYEYVLVRDSEMPDINPNNPKYQTLISAWKKLPLPVSQWLGPWLSGSLG